MKKNGVIPTGFPELEEESVESQRIYDGYVVKLDKDTVKLPNGAVSCREVIRHPGAVVVLPVDGEGNVYLVRQFRYPIGRALLEIPAGKLEYGEDPLTAARRELSEEVGADAREWISLGTVLPTPGFCDEVHHLYLARGLTFGETHPDEDEFLEQVKLPFDELWAMAVDGRLDDSKSVIAVMRAKERMGGN